jgi:proline iminopeptidase
VLIHGRLDLGGSLQVAWDLHRAWPGSELVVVDSGHLNSEPGMVEAIVAATDRFALELR